MSSLFSKANNFLHPRIGEIWCLHRVVTKRSWTPSNRVLEITPEYLEYLIRSYRECGFSFVSLDDLLTEAARWRICPSKMVNVSFDDGFEDVFTNAFPILKRYKVPFTIYLTTGFPDGTVRIWWVELEKIIEFEDSVTVSDGTVWPTGSLEGKILAYETICKRIMEGSRSPVYEYLDLIPASLRTSGHSAGLSLSWTQLREMIGSGLCTVESHSVSHPMLSKVSAEVAEREMRDSKSRIESMLGVRASHFSYPHSSFSDFCAGMLNDSGYDSAALGYGGGIRRGCPSYKLNRNHIIQK